MLVAVVVLAALLLLLYFAYGIREAPPRNLAIEGLNAEVLLHWHASDAATIESSNELDFLTALGYIHGLKRAWTITLWRQTAEGRLGEWFGEPALEMDRAARRLRLASAALYTYRQLDDSSRTRLDAYTRGMNASLLDRGARAREFAALGIAPEAWEPWHVLAIERLFSWLGTPDLQADTLSNAGVGLLEFAREDAALRRFLHLGGFTHGAAWTVQDSSNVVLVQRHVTGASALPVFFEIRRTQRDSTFFIGASLPGTPFFPAGRSEARAWAVLLSADAQLTRSVVDPASIDTLYGRIVLQDGEERLVHAPFVGGQLVLGQVARPFRAPERFVATPDSLVAQSTIDTTVTPVLPPPPDSVWLLAWPGLTPGTDLDAWAELVEGGSPGFELFDGAGLSMSTSGEASIIGAPRVLRAHPAGMFVSNSPIASFVVDRLDTLGLRERDDASPIPYIDDCHSTWAAQLEPRLVSAIDTLTSHARFMEEALTYLRNWDFSYDRTSIAASIFDHWMRAHRDSTGSLPSLVSVDTSLTARYQLYNSLVGTINMLSNEFGRDMSQWRWEVTEPHVFHFPVWSYDSLVSSALSKTRYAPIGVAGEGHPTTLCWGPSPVLDEVSQPGHWEAWISTASWDELHVRRRRLDNEAFLARYRIPDRPPSSVIVGPSTEVTGTTRLTPAP